MDHLHKTCLYTHHSGRPAIAHHRDDATLTCWPDARPRSGNADLLYYRHLLLEDPATIQVCFPDRKETTIFKHRPDVWNGQLPRGLRLIAEATEAELTIHHSAAVPEIRPYLGLPEHDPRTQYDEETEVISQMSGLIQIVKRLPDAVHFIEPEHRQPTGIHDALSFHLQYERLKTEKDEPWDFPLAEPTPIAVMLEQDFIPLQSRIVQVGKAVTIFGIGTAFRRE